MLQFRIIVTLEPLGYGATVRFGVERVLLSVPGINKRTRLLREKCDSNDSDERSRRYPDNQPDGPGNRCFDARNPQAIDVRDINHIVAAANARRNHSIAQCSSGRIESHLLATIGRHADNFFTVGIDESGVDFFDDAVGATKIEQ